MDEIRNIPHPTDSQIEHLRTSMCHALHLEEVALFMRQILQGLQ